MSPAVAVKTWHICISGFTQREGQLTGLARLWMDLVRYRTATTDVQLRTWDSNWSELAELIWLVGKETETVPRIGIYAYSWGGGWGFPNLARELEQRELSVDVAVLCDPVYRHCYWLGMWRSFMPWSRITIPANVKEVWSTFQRMNYPRGHKLVPAGKKTAVHQAAEVIATHHYCDESNVFKDQVMLAAEAISK